MEGVYGKRQGHLKFYDNLNAEELRKELEKRGCKEYPNSKHGKLGILKNILCGVQRVPSLLMFCPREALIEVAHLMVKSNSQSQAVCTLRKYILCLVQISKILYSKDANRTAKQCLQFYNCAFVSHELHLELFGETLNNM